MQAWYAMKSGNKIFELATGVATKFNGATIESYSYAYDALSRPTTRNSDTFGYNERGEVIFSRRDAENAEDVYAYDGIGNLLLSACNAATNTYTANNINQYTSILRDSSPHPSSDRLRGSLCSGDTREISHDLDGNMTSDGVISYTYDAENRLASVASNGIVLVANEYDYRGRRIKKTTPTTETTFVYDGWNIVHEAAATISGSTTNITEIQYFWGTDLSETLQGAGGVGGLLAVSINGDFYFPAYDNNGNITKYIDENGNVVAEYTYNAFGKTISQTGSLADFFRHRFSTKYFDTETGLYYYGYRFYSPSLMRWLNRDPIGEEGGLNLYVFCKNAQLFKIDADGHSVFNYFPFTSTILSAIESCVGHIPGSSATDYSFVSPRDCQCNIVGAEEQCKNKVKMESLQYTVSVLSSAAIARAIDLVITILTIHADSGVFVAFAADGSIGLFINAHAYAKIMEGANKAKSENCSCSQYGY